MPFNSYVLEWVLWMEQVRTEKKISGIFNENKRKQEDCPTLKKIARLNNISD